MLKFFTEQLSSGDNERIGGFLFCEIASAFCCICAQNCLQLSDLAELVQCRIPSVQQIWVWEGLVFFLFFSQLSVNTPLLRHMYSAHSNQQWLPFHKPACSFLHQK